MATMEPVPIWLNWLLFRLLIQRFMNLFMAANALGYGANWLTEWYSYDREALPHLGVKDGERVAGIMHVGTPTIPPADRPRPDVDTLVTWVV